MLPETFHVSTFRRSRELKQRRRRLQGRRQVKNEFVSYLRPRPHVSGYFRIRNFFFPDTATVHTYLANSTANPEKNKSALQSGETNIRSESDHVWTGESGYFRIRWDKKRVQVSHRTTGSFSIPRRRQRRERHQNKGFMSRTMAVNVHFEYRYISLPSSAKQQDEMTKFYVFWAPSTRIRIFSNPQLTVTVHTYPAN